MEFTKNKLYIRVAGKLVTEIWTAWTRPSRVPDTSDILADESDIRLPWVLLADGVRKEIGGASVFDDFGVSLYEWTGSFMRERTEDELIADRPSPLNNTLDAKLLELDRACESVIHAGIHVETSLGVKYFRMSDQDQINMLGYKSAIIAALSGLPSDIDTSAGVWYKADDPGEHHQYWSIDDFALIVSVAFGHKVKNLTYLDALKTHVRGLQDISEIESVYYGMALPEQDEDDGKNTPPVFTPMVAVTYDKGGNRLVMGSGGTWYVSQGANYTIKTDEEVGIEIAADFADFLELDAWNTQEDGAGLRYEVGQTIQVDEDMWLYPQVRSKE